MKSLMTATALVALVAASPALAQDVQDPAAPPPAIEDTAPDTMTPDTGPGMTAPPAETEPSLDAPDASPLPGDTASSADPFVNQQAAEETLASALIGSNVENSAGENLGSISDIVLDDSGSVNAVIVGVGGFLGIGQKNVGIAFDSIDHSTDADGNVVLTLDATREQLEAAPTFVTVAEAQQEMESNTPADPMAPSPMP